MKPRKPDFIDHGIIVEHDQCCAVEPDESAVYFMNDGTFHPSWKAQAEGWRLVKFTPFQLRIAKFFGIVRK